MDSNDKDYSRVPVESSFTIHVKALSWGFVVVDAEDDTAYTVTYDYDIGETIQNRIINKHFKASE